MIVASIDGQLIYLIFAGSQDSGCSLLVSIERVHQWNIQQREFR